MYTSIQRKASITQTVSITFSVELLQHVMWAQGITAHPGLDCSTATLTRGGGTVCQEASGGESEQQPRTACAPRRCVTLTGVERRGSQYTYEARTDVDARNLLKIQSHEVCISRDRCVQVCVCVLREGFHAPDAPQGTVLAARTLS